MQTLRNEVQSSLSVIARSRIIEQNLDARTIFLPQGNVIGPLS